jgi:energy-coupling factor transporter ATP-binding protein EcfA2
MSLEELPVNQAPARPIAVSFIEVERLHGKFDYKVDLLPETSASGQADGRLLTFNEDRLTLLYGRNGSGKTSLLRLLFHAVAAAENRGHRTHIAKTAFQRFVVKLTDGSFVSYSRDEEDLIGSCTAVVSRPGSQAIKWSVQPDEDGYVRAQEPQLVVWEDDHGVPHYRQDHQEEEFHRALIALDLNPIFLGDSRGITGDVIDKSKRSEEEARRGPTWRQRDEMRRAIDVEEAVELVRQYLASVAFAGAQAGSSKVDSVYLNVTKAIREHLEDSQPQEILLPNLIDRVMTVGKQVDRLHKYGLLSELPYKQLADQLKSTSEQKGELLQQVLGPYLEGLEKRVEALEPGLEAVSTFIDALNSFLEGKRAEFHLGPKGIVIRDDETGRRLSPQELSSGEKQIVLLFSDVVALQSQTRLFIVDEPEISLNPEWQRQLMPHLLDATKQSRMQLIAATHSIEILAQFRDRIHSLEA